ncbi:MAG TPA: FAD/NAD(P)-binding oxidoreductase [Chryseosolibacter sp.]
MKQVVIIGNGVAGITAARRIRKRSNHNITVISSESPYFFSRTALMYVYMGHLKFEHIKPYEDGFWRKNRIDLAYDHAEHIDIEAKSVQLRSGKNLGYDTLIIASGSRSNVLDVHGRDLLGVQTLYSYHDLERMESNTRGIRQAVIVGGGLIGVEMAEMLRSRNIDVTMLVREAAFWNNILPIQEAKMISNHITSHGVVIQHEEELQEIATDGNEKVKAIYTRKGEQIPCDFVGITVGVHPNVSWLHDSGIKLKQGILVNEYLETNIPDVYAIGDCVEHLYPLEGRKNIEQVWYTARMMGEVVAQTVTGLRTPYQPGPWFNSAKFFDIEYQTYGIVPNIIPDEQDEFYWEHPQHKKAIHLVWDKNTNQLIGINSFGIRLRHEKFDQWLREKRSAKFVMDHLSQANFDPEFSDRHESEIRDQFLRKELSVV